MQTLLFGIFAFTVIFVVIDAMENLDDFVDQNVPTLKILHYYFVFSPEIIKLMTPVGVLFGALFTAGKSANLSELTAMRASGVSLFRFMAPFLITTLIISSLAVYFGGYLVPMANKTKLSIEREYLKKNISFAGSNIYFQDDETKIVGISYFDSNNDIANKVSIQNFDKDDQTRMDSRIDATRLKYDSTNSNWIAISGVKRIFDGDSQTTEYFDSLRIDDLNFLPKDLVQKQQRPQEMDLSELDDLIESQQRAGNDPTASQIEFHSRFAFAFTSFIVVLFGLPISVNKRKGGLAVQVGISILVTFIYLVMMKVSQAFGKNDALNPLLTAWFANILFFVGALMSIYKLRH